MANKEKRERENPLSRYSFQVGTYQITKHLEMRKCLGIYIQQTSNLFVSTQLSLKIPFHFSHIFFPCIDDDQFRIFNPSQARSHCLKNKLLVNRTRLCQGDWKEKQSHGKYLSFVMFRQRIVRSLSKRSTIGEDCYANDVFIDLKRRHVNDSEYAVYTILFFKMSSKVSFPSFSPFS